jgi:hypothetical protein
MFKKRRIQRLEAFLHYWDVRAWSKPPPRRLQTVQDVIDVLQEQVEALRAEAWAGTVERARAIGYLAGIARRAIETGKIAERLEMLETVLKNRKGGDKQ